MTARTNGGLRKRVMEKIKGQIKVSEKKKAHEEKGRDARAEEQRKAYDREEAERLRELAKAKSAKVAQMVADPLLWLQEHTETKDNHWREAGAPSCYRRFPDKPYFRPLVDAFQNEPVLFIEKSRDM